MLTHINSIDIQIRWIIFKADIDKNEISEYLNEFRKIERMKSKVISRVDIFIHHYYESDWHNSPVVKKWMSSLVKLRPHIFYFLTKDSSIFLIKCITDYKGDIKQAIKEDQTIRDYFRATLNFCADINEQNEMAIKLQSISGLDIVQEGV